MTFDVTTNVSDEESYILLILECIYAKIVLSWILLSLSGGFHISTSLLFKGSAISFHVRRLHWFII